MNMNPGRIISEIEYEHGMKPGMLASRTVTKFVSAARRKAINALRKAGLSYPEIGKHLNRDHSSIMDLVGARKRPVNNAGKTRGKRAKKRG